MNVPFYKYQGTGNDFIVVDFLDQSWFGLDNQKLIETWCDRKFGVGADGLIVLLPDETHDFRMIYFNADGLEGSMCGNGGRCAVACMHALGRIDDHCIFQAYDGLHRAKVISPDYVELSMQNVEQIQEGRGHFILETGSPHYVTFVEDLDDLDIVETGRAIRYSDPFRKEGINVNFVEEIEDGILVHTYERGVEDETLSCGTGVTAAALALAVRKGINNAIKVSTKGGELVVRFSKSNGRFEGIWLCGPAKLVFNGLLPLP